MLASAFFTVPEELPQHISKAEAILAKEFEKFPDSALFLFTEGRLHRLKVRACMHAYSDIKQVAIC